MSESSQQRLRASGLLKAYAVPVLSDFDFDLEEGEVHALVGSNGAGKSTFAKIVCGLVARDEGRLWLDGQPYSPSGMRDAEASGVVMVHQELNIIPTLSIAENLFLDRLPTQAGWVKRRELREKAQAALERVGLKDLSPDTPAGELGVGQQQLMEIAAALARNCRVLILDEPTAALTAPEIEILFENIRKLQEEGVGVIYISHRMDEIRRIADRVTVLRDGRRIHTHPAKEIGVDQLVSEMAGHEVVTRCREDRHREQGRALIEVSKLSSLPQVRDASLQVHQGEILGIAGLIGSGRTELLEAIYGVRHVDSGTVSLGGDSVPQVFRSPADAVKAGLAMAPEDRKQDGLLLSKSVLINTTLATLDQHSGRGFMKRDAEVRTAEEKGHRMKLKYDSVDQAVVELSGGNQQKVVLARWLARDANVLLLDEPTRGIDVPAKELIYELLHELAEQGKGVLVVSSDLPELMSLCDRILVMSAGRIAGEFHPDTWTQEAITQAAFSGYLEGGQAA